MSNDCFQFFADGALFHTPTESLYVADLHFEKGSAYAATGQLLPPYDTLETLNKLEARLAVTRPSRVISLGDSLHDVNGYSRMPVPAKEKLNELTAHYPFIWVSGNHDPELSPEMGDEYVDEYVDKNIVARHIAWQDVSSGMIELSGHFHPKARLTIRRRKINGPCFVRDRRRILLPAFGSYTGGLDISHPDIQGLFPDGGDVIFCGPNTVHRLPMQLVAG